MNIVVVVKIKYYLDVANWRENMKRSLMAICIIAFAGTPQASELTFGAVDTIRCAGLPIDVGKGSDPFVVDWDGDGLKDLIVGQFYDQSGNNDGKIRVYINDGMNSDPTFSSWFYMQADGSDIVCDPG